MSERRTDNTHPKWRVSLPANRSLGNVYAWSGAELPTLNHPDTW